MSMSLLEAFGAAWNRHDLDAIMEMTADDGEFWASAGPDACGQRFVGKEAVRAAYAGIFATFPDGQWTNGRLTLISPDRGLSEWRFVGTKADGTRTEVDGLDLSTSRGARCGSRTPSARPGPPDRPLAARFGIRRPLVRLEAFLGRLRPYDARRGS